MTPAVVIGSGLGALGALRLLHRAGIPAYSLPAAPSFESRSRWCRAVPGVRTSFGGEVPLGEILGGCALESGVLIPCSDAALSAITQLPAPLAALSQQYSFGKCRSPAHQQGKVRRPARLPRGRRTHAPW